MNRKSDKTMEPALNERTVVLRFIPRDDREPRETETGPGQKNVPDRKIQPPPRDGDDDDPGPAAA